MIWIITIIIILHIFKNHLHFNLNDPPINIKIHMFKMLNFKIQINKLIYFYRILHVRRYNFKRPTSTVFMGMIFDISLIRGKLLINHRSFTRKISVVLLIIIFSHSVWLAYSFISRMALSWSNAPIPVTIWNSWCEWPQMSNFPGRSLSRFQSCVMTRGLEFPGNYIYSWECVFYKTQLDNRPFRKLSQINDNCNRCRYAKIDQSLQSVDTKNFFHSELKWCMKKWQK